MNEKKIVIAFGFIVSLMLSFFNAVPVGSWVYPDCTEDTHYELFGPRLDRIFIDMYATEEPMWTALKDGKIDVTDWPLSRVWYTEFTSPEYAGKIKVCFAGGEAGFYEVNFNHDNRSEVDPGVPNPIITAEMAANPMAGNETTQGGRSGLALRRAIALLFNRTRFTDTYMGAMGDHMYTPVPTYMGGYVHPEINPTGLLKEYAYVYNRTKASEILNASIYKMGADGWRYMDLDDDNVREAGEELKPTFNYRQDHAGRRKAGEMLVEEMAASGIRINVVACPLSALQNYIKSMLEDNFHMSTFGWINVGPDPDYLHDLFTEAGYWYDPTSSCNNEGYLNDPILNDIGRRIKYANTFDEAKQATIDFQVRFAFLAAQLPLYCNVAYKAHSVKYVGDGGATGPEDKYEGKNWTGIVNQVGFGTNSWWTFLNAHPEPDDYGDCAHMTMRYGWKTVGYPQHINPIYAEWYWDHEVLNKMYDSLGFRDPYDPSIWKPWLVKTWKEGTWVHPITGETLTKVTLTLRPDITWSDGVPFSMADVIFTLVESTPMLLARGFPPPWYYPQVETIISYTILDACNVELLLDVKSVYAIGWILGGEYIIPKHIWKPIIETGNPTLFQPDPNCIATGPYKFVSHTPDVSVILEKNPTFFNKYPKEINVHTLMVLERLTPGVVSSYWHEISPHFSLLWIITEWRDNWNGILDQSDWVQLNGTVWYHVFDYNETTGHLALDLWDQKLNLLNTAVNRMNVTIGIEDHNLICQYFVLSPIVSPPPPVGSVWHGEWPLGIRSCEFQAIEWIDQNETGELDPCDIIVLDQPDGPVTPLYFHVAAIGPTIYEDRLIPPGWIVIKEVLVADKYIRVYEDVQGANTLVYFEGPILEFEKPCHPIKEIITVELGVCHHQVKVAKHIINQWHLLKNNTVVLSPWYCKWKNVTYDFWVTIKEDIGGKWFDTWHTPPQIRAPDCKVTGLDITMVAWAFGSYPGHPRWNSIADVNRDYEINIIDLACICKLFGWMGQPFPSPRPPEPQPYEVFLNATIPKTVACQTWNFTVHIDIVNVTNLYAYDIRLRYNTTLVEFLYFYTLTPPPDWGTSYQVVPGYIAVSSIGAVSPFNGSMTLAVINFTAKVKGNLTMDLSDSVLATGCRVSEIPYTTVNDSITISMVGDITGGTANLWDFVPNGRVGGEDLTTVCRCFGSWPGAQPPLIWNPNCDVDNDGKVSGYDVTLVARHFGEWDP